MNESRALTPPNSLLKTLLPGMVLGIAGLFVAFQFLLQTSVSVMIPDLQQSFHIDMLDVSLLSSSFFYTYLALQIPSGILVDRYGARKTLFICLLGAAFSCALFSVSHVLSVAELSRVLLGVFSAPAVVATLYLAARWFPVRYFALLAGLSEMLGMFGGAAGQALLARSVSLWGWRETLFFCGILAFVMAWCAWFIVREHPPEKTLESVHHKVREPILKSIWYIISLPQAWVYGLFAGLLFGVAAAFAGFWCVPFLMHCYPISVSLAADMSAMVFVGMAIGAPLLGEISARWEQRRWLMAITTILMTAILLAVIYLPFLPLPLMFLLLFSLGFFCSIYVLPFAMMRDFVSPSIQSTAMGYINMMSIVLGAPLLQPFIAWVLRQHTQLPYTVRDYQFALTLLPISLVFALLLICFMQDKR